nr:hypothetical protein [uncultured Pseudomonas sp.]
MSDYQNKLRHLSAEQVEQLYQEYLGGARNAALIERYKLDLAPNCLIKSFPPVASPDVTCPYCATPMYERRRGKTSCSWDIDPAFCKGCDHRHYPPGRTRLQRYCTCAPCKASRLAHEQQQSLERRQRIQAQWSLDDIPGVPLASLGFTSKVQLLALLLTRADQANQRLTPLAELRGDARLTPTQDMDSMLLHALREHKILLIDPGSSLDAFSNGSALVPRVDKVCWIVNVYLGRPQRATLTQLQQALLDDLSQGPLPAWHGEIVEALHRLAVEEVYAYILSRAADHGLPFDAWKKSREVAAQLLLQLPIRSIWSLTNTAIRGALAFAAQCQVNKHIASNTIPGRMLSLGQRAVEERWPFRWPGFEVKAPRSNFSHVLHGVVLKLDDHGLEQTLFAYISQLPAPGGAVIPPAGSIRLHCVSCGSAAVHAQANAIETIVNCKDCMARTVIINAQ